MNRSPEQSNGEYARGQPRLTTRGLWLLWVSVGLISTGIMLSIPLLMEVSLFCLFLVPVSVLICKLNLSRVGFTPSIPAGVFSGDDFHLQLALENSKRWLGSFDTFVSYRIARRHKETFFTFVGPCRQTIQTKVMRISQRGAYEGLWCQIRSDFPFGLAERENQTVLASKIVVYPQPRLPPYVLRMLESGMGSGCGGGSATRDVSGYFRLMREYYPGDTPKLISWPASRRRRKLLVREMEQPEPRRFTVLFHSYQPPNVVLSRRSFEHSLEILSGIFVHLLENGLPIIFLASFNNWEPVDIGADSQSQKNGFELLASAAMNPSAARIDFAGLLKHQYTRNTSVMIMSNTPVRRWRHMVSGLKMPVLCADNTEGETVAVER